MDFEEEDEECSFVVDPFLRDSMQDGVNLSPITRLGSKALPDAFNNADFMTPSETTAINIGNGAIRAYLIQAGVYPEWLTKTPSVDFASLLEYSHKIQPARQCNKQQFSIRTAVERRSL